MADFANPDSSLVKNVMGGAGMDTEHWDRLCRSIMWNSSARIEIAKEG